MTATTAAASNGSTGTATGKPERLTGMAQVREAEAYHTASVMHDAIFEADRLCSAIHRAVTDAYLTRIREDQPDPGTASAAETASSPEVRDQAAEALRWMSTCPTGFGMWRGRTSRQRPRRTMTCSSGST